MSPILRGAVVCLTFHLTCVQFLSTEGEEWVEPTNNSSAGRPYFEELLGDGRGVSDFNPLLTFSLSKNDFLRGSAEIVVWVQICFFAALRLRSALDEHCAAAGSAGPDCFRALHKAPFSLLISQLIGLDQKCGTWFPLSASAALHSCQLSVNNR